MPSEERGCGRSWPATSRMPFSRAQAEADITRERSLEADLERSSACLGAWLVSEQSTPSEQAMRHEQAVLLANALSGLPTSQREALVLHYWQGFSLAKSPHGSNELRTPLRGFSNAA